MKLISINVENVLGIRSAHVALTTPITLICGGNHNGKTSLAESVRMALGADIHARGIAMKKDLQALVNDGAKAGSVEVQLADGLTPFALVPSGKTTPQDVYVPHRALPFVLEPERFAALEPNERRAFLFNLMGLRVTPELVVEKLTARGVDQAKAVRVGPLLKAGFDAACTEAKRKGTEAKGAWRAVTGETYGAVKAETWAAPVPAHDAEAAKKLSTEIKHADVALETWQQTIGKLQGEEQRRAAQRAKLPALLEQAGKLERIEAKLATDRTGLAAAERALAQALAASGQAPRAGLLHELAWSASFLIFYGDPLGDSAEEQRVRAAMEEYEAAHGKISFANDADGDPEARAQLPSLRAALDLMVSAVANSQRDQLAALKARDDAQEIEAGLKEEFDEKALAAARSEIEKIKAARAEAVKKLDVINAQKVAADAAKKKTDDAAAHHADVAAWDQIAEALAPDGIPGEMLAAALGPFNDRLAQSAADAEWARIEVGADMSITGALHERPYKLMSESEKWRADAMLAEAISHLSGLKLLMLDRFDVLGHQGRTDLFAWLEILADGGEIETAIVLGTLKGLPAGLPSCVSSHWVEGGFIGELKAAA